MFTRVQRKDVFWILPERLGENVDATVRELTRMPLEGRIGPGKKLTLILDPCPQSLP